MLQILKDDHLICTISLAGVSTSKDIGAIEVKFNIKDEYLIDEFRYLFCTTSGILGKCLSDGMTGVLLDWGVTDFDNLDYILSRFPESWQVKVVDDRPKHDPFVSKEDGVFY